MRALGIVVAGALSAALAVTLGSGPDRVSRAVPVSAEPVSEPRAASGGPKIDAETREQVGSFALGRNRKIRVSLAGTVDGLGCLIEEEQGVESSSCLDGGLFAKRKAEVLVSSQGGPDRFEELHLVGVVAPNVRSVAVVKTDGAAVQIQVGAGRAFLFESSAADLEARVYPTALRLYGPSGKLVETVDFPAAG